MPDAETLSWHHAREEFVANELYGKSPEVKGAIVGTEEGKRVWCVWMRTWYNSDPQKSKGNSLNILRLVVEDPEYTDFNAASDDGVEQAKGSYVTAAIASLLAAGLNRHLEPYICDARSRETIESWNTSYSPRERQYRELEMVWGGISSRYRVDGQREVCLVLSKETTLSQNKAEPRSFRSMQQMRVCNIASSHCCWSA